PAKAPLKPMAQAPSLGDSPIARANSGFLPRRRISLPVLLPFVKKTAQTARTSEMGKARLKGEGGARRGRRRLGAIAGIARRLESGSRKGPPTAQSTAIAAAWARRKLVSMTWAPVRRS